MNFDIKILLIVVIALIFGADIVYQAKSKKRKTELLNELNSLLAKEEYKAFDKLVESDEVKKSFPPYNLAYIKLNKAMMVNNPSEITKAFSNFNIRMSKSQKEIILKRAFYYYIGIEDIARTKHYYELLKKQEVKDQVTLDIMYDVYVDKGYKFLDEVLDNYKNLPKDEQPPYYVLLADMYKNKGETSKSKEYEELAKKYMNSINN